MPARCQADAVLAFATRSDLAAQVLSLSNRRLGTVRKMVGSERLSTRDVNALAKTCVALGVYRVLMSLYAAEKKLTAEWWGARRKALGFNTRDRTSDLVVIYENCPDFADYLPGRELTDREVLAAAVQEFRDQIAGPGTDYHERNAQSEKYREGLSPVVGPAVVARDPAFRGGEGLTRDRVLRMECDIASEDGQEQVENFFDYQLLNDENHVLGPAVTRAAAIAFREFGPSAVYWIAETIFFPKRFTELLRHLAGSERDLGLKEFERVKRDMSRKIPEMHAQMIRLLRDDPRMQELRTICQPGLISANATLPESEATRIARARVADEREQYLARQTIRLFREIARDPDTAPYLLDVQALASVDPTAFDQFLHGFIAATDEFKLQSFFRRIRRSFSGEAAA